MTAPFDPVADVRAPAGAVGWTPRSGWVYEPVDLPTRVTNGDYVLVVGERDGMVRGVTAVTTAPLVAVLRIDTELTELRDRLTQVAETAVDLLAARAPGGAS
jgi:hypothetical protein